VSQKKRSHLFGAALVALALLAAACGGSDGGTASDGGTTPAPDTTTGGTAARPSDPLAPQPLPEPTPVRVVLSTKIEPYLAPLLAQELGEFEKENLGSPSRSPRPTTASPCWAPATPTSR
jgi:ABC-type glycerol-3-phosphate transport system substrate-binding protein